MITMDRLDKVLDALQAQKFDEVLEELEGFKRDTIISSLEEMGIPTVKKLGHTDLPNGTEVSTTLYDGVRETAIRDKKRVILVERYREDTDAVIGHAKWVMYMRLSPTKVKSIPLTCSAADSDDDWRVEVSYDG